MFSWLTKLFGEKTPKEEWRLVYTVIVPITMGVEPTKKTGKFFYHLHESDTGTRRVEYGCTLAHDYLDDLGRRFEDYHETVYPWLQGRYMPGIPVFNDIDALDVSRKLLQ